MCKWMDKCPSVSGWCRKNTTVDDDCAPFIFTTIENLRAENEKLREKYEKDVNALTRVIEIIYS